ncbi:MAG: hypothetical protein LBM02_09845 [Lachnospiraceae bacterium]|jgi:ribonucleoside-diphosphate reductase alpha chain|nr:hypothetical protein [Lachnospiraceae bacterium]
MKNAEYWWLNAESKNMLERGYLLPGETVDAKLDVICNYASKYYKDPKLKDKFKELFVKGWCSLSSPIWANFGENRGLPISCFNSYIPDTLSGIYDGLSEVAIMTQKGGGTSGYFGKLRPKGAPIKGGGTSSGSVSFIKLFDNTMNVVSQGGVRRGAFAAYIDIDHPDVEEFLTIKDKESDLQSLNFAVNVTDYFMKSMIEGDVEKRELWAKVLKSRREKGMPYINFIDTVNKNKPQIYKDTNSQINSSNLCVTGETKILTKELGYYPIKLLEGSKVEVWNGEEWSEVTVRRTGEDTQFIEVQLNSGNAIKCTTNHKFYIKYPLSGNIIEKRATELKKGDELIDFNLPIITDGDLYFETAYNDGYNTTIYDYIVEDNIPNVPYSIKHRLEWLNGFFDRIKCTESKETEELQLWFTEYSGKFVEYFQLFLQTLGCKSFTKKDENNNFIILIPYQSVDTLRELGVTSLDDIDLTDGFSAPEKIIVTNLNQISYVSPIPTYCFTEPKRHMGMFNGILTGNCNEIHLPTNEEESFVCCLMSMNLATYDEWKDTDAIKLAVYFLDAVMDDFIKKTKDMPYMERAHKFALRHRALGLGILGWHSLLQQKMIPFESFEAQLLNTSIFKDLKEKSYLASVELGEKYGYAPIFEEGETSDIKRRNTTLLAIAPTTSSASILGQVSPGIEPFASNYFVVGLAKGSFTRRNQDLEKLLESKNKNTEDIWESIILNEGSVQHLDFLSDDEKAVFKTFTEISPLAVIQQAAARQKFIDQGQSLNLKIPASMTPKQINKLYIEAWESGVKGLYYQRGTSVAKEKVLEMMNCKACEG